MNLKPASLLGRFLNLGVWFVVFAYLFIAVVNFFSPIIPLIAFIIIVVSGLAAFSASQSRFFDTFKADYNTAELEKNAPFWFFISIAAVSLVWFLIVIFRSTLDTDANVYHLPLALLMNKSIWYPGIGKLCSLFGLPNGNSVLASVFTVTGVAGFENIPNLMIWFIFGAGIFAYLRLRGVPIVAAGLAVSALIFSPDFFWQSYNMGTDLPQACFLVFGFFAFSRDCLEEAFLFFALAAIFKPLGLVMFGMVFVWAVIRFVVFRKPCDLAHPALRWSVGLILVFLTRMFVATGNPVYPIGAFKFVSWGINPPDQKALSYVFSIYSGLNRTLGGYAEFIKYFFYAPHRFNSEYWFSPFFIISCVLSGYYFIKDREYKKISLNTKAVLASLSVAIVIWLYFSPLFRFIAGVFVFSTVIMFCSIYLPSRGRMARAIMMFFVAVTIGLFAINIIKHIKKDVIGVVAVPAVVTERFLPFSQSIFSPVILPDGFKYWRSSSNYSGRMPSPCISRYSIGSADDLVKEYRRYNNL